MNLERALGRHSAPADRPPSLAGAPVGRRVRITRIIFRLVRDLCDGLNLSRGDEVRVEERSDGTVTVQNSEGRPVDLPVHFAHFILISEPDSPAQ